MKIYRSGLALCLFLLCLTGCAAPALSVDSPVTEPAPTLRPAPMNTWGNMASSAEALPGYPGLGTPYPPVEFPPPPQSTSFSDPNATPIEPGVVAEPTAALVSLPPAPGDVEKAQAVLWQYLLHAQNGEVEQALALAAMRPESVQAEIDYWTGYCKNSNRCFTTRQVIFQGYSTWDIENLLIFEVEFEDDQGLLFHPRIFCCGHDDWTEATEGYDQAGDAYLVYKLAPEVFRVYHWANYFLD